MAWQNSAGSLCNELGALCTSGMYLVLRFKHPFWSCNVVWERIVFDRGISYRRLWSRHVREEDMVRGQAMFNLVARVWACGLVRSEWKVERPCPFNVRNDSLTSTLPPFFHFRCKAGKRHMHIVTAAISSMSNLSWHCFSLFLFGDRESFFIATWAAERGRPLSGQADVSLSLHETRSRRGRDGENARNEMEKGSRHFCEANELMKLLKFGLAIWGGREQAVVSLIP